MDILHSLIRDMSVAEKSYFKRYAAKLSDDSSSTNYTQLFDAIAAQDEYDEAKLKKKFAKEKFAKQFSVAKNYLYRSVIKALKNFYEESSVQSRVKHQLLELSILIDKGIYAQAIKVLEKARELAQGHELFADLHELLSTELYLLQNGYKEETESRNISKLIEELQRCSEQLQNLASYEALNSRQHTINKTHYQLRTGQQLADYEAIFTDPVLGNIDRALSDRARYYFHYMRSLHFSVMDRRTDFLDETRKLVALCSVTPYFLSCHQRGYLNSLNLLLEASYFNTDWETMNETLHSLKALEVNQEREKIAQFIYYSRFALIYFDQKKMTAEKVALIDEAWKTIRKYEAKIPFHIRISSYVTYTSALLEMGEYSRALDWIELYRQRSREGDVRYDVQTILLLMQLIAHYEMDNIMLVRNIIPGIARFIRSIGQQSDFEKVVLSFLNKLTSSKDLDDKIFHDTLKELDTLREGDILHRNRTMHDIFRIFIQSKKEKKAFHESATG